MTKECMTCKRLIETHEKKFSSSWLADFGGTVFSLINHRPSTKGHFNVVTKRHADDLRTMTDQEWADILPVLKDGINKIESYFQKRNKPGPLGYRISIPVGKEGNQDSPGGQSHFYLRAVPKYKKFWSNTGVPKEEWDDPDPDYDKHRKQLRTTLQPNSEKIVEEKNKLIAKLHEEEEMIVFTKERLTGMLAISTKKHLPNDINAIDQETWNEIGQTLKELMAKIEANTDCHNFNISILLGKEAIKTFKEECQISSTPYQENELVITMNPRFKRNPWWLKKNRSTKNKSIDKKHKFIGAFEHERLAKKFRDPEAYYKEWGKELPQQKKEVNTRNNSFPTETSQRERVFENNQLFI